MHIRQSQVALLNGRQSARPRPEHAGIPFNSAQEAWFWTMGALRARREGGSGGGSWRNPPCTPDDILRCLDRLYRAQRIDAAHAQVLQIWGERQMPPDGGHRGSGERALWREALERLGPLLREKGIVAR